MSTARWWGRPLAEMRWQAEFLRLLADPIYLRGGRPRGDGRPVVLLPGFAGGDWTLQHLAFWLRRTGYRAVTCGLVLNAGCPDRALERVERRVAVLAADGRRVAIVGHSRGGHLARAAAARRPDLVSHVVAMGAGLSRQFEAAAPALAAVALARAAQRRPGCLTEDCACGFGAGYRAPFPDEVRLTSIYSKGDGMVRWSSCVVPYADNVEIAGSHVGLAWNRKAYGAIATALGRPEI
jgi:pimeloyl-ACP methyl ester carboxylesterase